jgi:hypothetical protein
MPKLPDYRLQVLFEIREKAKKAAEEVYAEKKKLAAEEQQKHDAMKQNLRDMVAAREQRKQDYAERMRSGELNVNQITANDRHIEKMKQEENAYQVEINRQGERVVEAEAVAEEAMQDMLKASQDYKALEKHKEKWVKGVKREIQIKEEEAVEDIAQAQYFARLKEQREEEKKDQGED